MYATTVVLWNCSHTGNPKIRGVQSWRQVELLWATGRCLVWWPHPLNWEAFQDTSVAWQAGVISIFHTKERKYFSNSSEGWIAPNLRLTWTDAQKESACLMLSGCWAYGTASKEATFNPSTLMQRWTGGCSKYYNFHTLDERVQSFFEEATSMPRLCSG